MPLTRTFTPAAEPLMFTISMLVVYASLMFPVISSQATLSEYRHVKRLEESIPPSVTEAHDPGVARAVPGTPSNSSIPGYAYLGCYADPQPANLALPFISPQYLLNGWPYTSPSGMSWSVCTSYCSGSKYAAITVGSTCRCGNSLTFPAGLATDSSCHAPCTGNASQSCGANGRSTVFFNSNFGNNSPSSSAVQSTIPLSTLPSSLSTSLQASTQIDLLASSATRTTSLTSPFSASSSTTVTKVLSASALPTSSLAGPLDLNLGLSSFVTRVSPAANPLVSSTIRPVLDLAAGNPIVSVSGTTSSTSQAVTSLTSILSPPAVAAPLFAIAQSKDLSATSSSSQQGALFQALLALTPIAFNLVPATISTTSLSTPIPLASSTNALSVNSGAPSLTLLPSSSLEFAFPSSPVPGILSSASPPIPGPPVLPSSASFPTLKPFGLLAAAFTPPPLAPVQVSTASIPVELGSSAIIASIILPSVVDTLPTLASAPKFNALGLVPLPEQQINAPSQGSSIASAPKFNALGLVPLPEQQINAPSQGNSLAPTGALSPIVAALSLAASSPVPIASQSSAGPVSVPTISSSPAPVVAPSLPAGTSNIQLLSGLNLPNAAAVVPGLGVPSVTAALPLISSPALAILPSPLPPRIESIPLIAETPLPSVASAIPPSITSSVEAFTDETTQSWWIVTEFLEPHGLPEPTLLAPPPPLPLPVQPPSVKGTNGQKPGVSAPFSIASSDSAGPSWGGIFSVPETSPEAVLIESGTVIDKSFTWTLYDTGLAQVNDVFLSPVTGPLQAYLADGTRIGMDSEGLYIGWDHRIPYPPAFLSVVKDYSLPAPQLLL